MTDEFTDELEPITRIEILYNDDREEVKTLEEATWKYVTLFDKETGDITKQYSVDIINSVEQESIDKKIQSIFEREEEKFSEKSSPTYLDKYGNRITLQEIHDEADIGDKSVVLIAVTSEQYNIDNFSKYREHIKNNLNKNRIYYGLWPDKVKSKTEWDVLYTIENNSDEIQKHLNLHNDINNGVTQKMALIIDKNGSWKIQSNESYSQTTSNSLGGI